MSNTNNNMQTQRSSALHNAIMEAGGKDSPPMLAPGNYVQWKPRIKRYIDTKPNQELIHYCLEHPPYKFKWAERTIPVAEAEAVHIILTWIENDIYSIVDACPNAMEMWKAIERLKQVLTSITTRMTKQHKNEVHEIRAERLARTANPLALVAKQQPVYHSQPHPTHYTQNSSTRSQQAATRNRGKAIVNSPSPIYDQEPDMVTEDDALSKEKDIDKLIDLISISFKKIYKPTNNNLRTSSNTNDTDDEHEDQELEAHYLYIAQIQEATPDAANNSGPIFDDDVFANDKQHLEQPESVNDTYTDEQGHNNIIIDSLDMSTNRDQADHDDDDLVRERNLLASLIEKLKCDIDKSKNRNQFLESSN
ncbi:hypothetical protein Tco_0458753 [Tanacetum coccineum]